MLCTSLTLCPSIDGTLPSNSSCSTALPVELLNDVYVCVSSPAVTEEWQGWPHAPYTSVSGGATHQISTSSVQILLPTLVQLYEADSMQLGNTAVQVIAVDAHSGLSREAKAMVAGAVMTAMRAHLHQLLINNSSLENGCEESNNDIAASDTLQMREVLKKCCRFSQGSALSSARAAQNIEGEDKEGDRKTEGGTWRVTWSAELLTHIASSLAQHGMQNAATTTICRCKDALLTSLECSVRARLQRDLPPSPPSSLEPSKLFASQNFQHVSNAGNRSKSEINRCDALAVQLVKCTPALTHPLSVQHAIDLGCLLYSSHVCPAQEHAEDGTEAFKTALKLAAQDQQCRDTRAVEQWMRAFQCYRDSAVVAQEGVLYVLTHELAVHGGAALTPLRAAEERARVQVSVATLNALRRTVTGGVVEGEAKIVDEVLAPMRLHSNSSGSSGGAYFNSVLLSQPWDLSVCAAQSAIMQTVKKLEEEAALEPARAALQWRSRLGHQEVTVETQAALKQGPTLQPTPFQWILYTLRRQLIVAVSNTAQVVLTGQRWRLDEKSISSPTSSRVAVSAHPLAVSSLRAQALSCVKAQAVLRGLIQWHCPYPPPPLLLQATTVVSRVRDEGIVISQAAAEELLWCLRLLAKLHLRAAALYGCVGDVSSQQGQLRQWQDQLQRWNSRRRAAAAPTTTTSAVSSWSTSVESVVGHVEESVWVAFLKEVSAA